jgi:isopentenyldiphosphate isomerase
VSSVQSTTQQQNDPAELLEVFSASGSPTGIAKPRAAIHLDGDWHQAFHCWIVRPRQPAELVLQRRALAKDTFPGMWDASAAGHWRFGESAEQAARELAEELGLDVPFERLTYSGVERSPREFENGLIDRELHQVYVLVDDRPLREYRPDPREVSDVAAFTASELIHLANGQRESIEATESISGQVRIRRGDVVPYSAERLARLLKSANHG